MLDVRTKEEYDKSHVRESFHVPMSELTPEKLAGLVVASTASSKKVNPKPADNLRRIVVISSGTLDPKADKAFQTFIGIVNASKSVSQIAHLKEGFAPMQAKYPYVCVGPAPTDAEYGLALSRFPSVLSEGKLYLVFGLVSDYRLGELH